MKVSVRENKTIPFEMEFDFYEIDISTHFAIWRIIQTEWTQAQNKVHNAEQSMN